MLRKPGFFSSRNACFKLFLWKILIFIPFAEADLQVAPSPHTQLCGLSFLLNSHLYIREKKHPSVGFRLELAVI